MSEVRLIHGDALTVLRDLPEASVPLIVTDPPYGIGYHSNHYKGKNPHDPVANDWNFQIGLFLQECARVLSDGGALYLFCRWDVTPLWLPYVSSAGLKVKTIIAWVKDNWSAGDLEGCFGNQYEQLLFVTKGRHLLRGNRWSNVWNFSRVPSTRMLHPTQKPVALLERAIESSSNEGDLVLDCFAGSGSTGEAAINTSRKCLLADIDPKMVRVAAKRLNIKPDGDLPFVGEDHPVDVNLEVPNPADWGVHPEDLRTLLDVLRGNVNDVKPAIAQRRIAEAQGVGTLFPPVRAEQASLLDGLQCGPNAKGKG